MSGCISVWITGTIILVSGAVACSGTLMSFYPISSTTVQYDQPATIHVEIH